MNCYESYTQALEEYQQELENRNEEYAQQLEEYQEKLEEYNEACAQQQEEYQEQLEEYNETCAQLQEEYEEDFAQRQEEYEERLEEYNQACAQQQEEYQEHMAGSPASGTNLPHYWPLTEEEYGDIYGKAYDAVYTPGYDRLFQEFRGENSDYQLRFDKLNEQAAQAGQMAQAAGNSYAEAYHAVFDPGYAQLMEGEDQAEFQNKTSQLSKQAVQAANQAVEEAKNEKRNAMPPVPPQGQPWGSWQNALGSLGRELSQTLSGLGQEISTEVNQAINEVFGKGFPFGGDEEDDNIPFVENDDNEEAGDDGEKGTPILSQEAQLEGDEYAYHSVVKLREIERLYVDWLSGTVILQPWDQDYIDVAEYSKKLLPLEAKMVLYVHDACQLSIQFRPKNRGSFGWGWSIPSKRLIIRIPRAQCSSVEKLRVSTVSGTVVAQELAGENFSISSTSGTLSAQGLAAENMDLRAVSGTLTFQGSSAEKLNLHTVSGTLVAEGFHAERAELGTVSGTLRAHGNAESFKVHTTSGRAELVVDQCPEKAEMNSVSGALRLVLPENNGFTAKFSSISGGFATDFPAEVNTEKKRKGRAVYGNGETKIKMNTTSGSMRIDKA